MRGGDRPPEPAEVASDPAVDDARARRPGFLRRLYDWVLGWADTRFGTPALFVLAAAESIFFPIPPDPLLMALCLGKVKKSLRFAAVATVASVVGGVIGYVLGAGAWSLVGDWFFANVPGVSEHAFERVGALYDRWDFWAVFLAGLTPIPYKVFTLSAGVFGISFPIFLIASAMSRGLRFFVVAGLIRLYGKPIAAFIDRWFNWLSLAFGVLLVGGFALIRWVL